jgi:hypothetical protein
VVQTAISEVGKWVVEFMKELDLKNIADEVIPRLSSFTGVIRIIGVGSYYIPENKPSSVPKLPSDLDYLLVLDFSFTDFNKTHSLASSLRNFEKEYAGKNYGKNVRSIVSIFLQDVDENHKLGEDLCDVHYTQGELEKETKKTKHHRINWPKGKVLWDKDW